jgi:hypothetical protein
MDTVVQESGKDPVTLSRPIPEGPTISVPQDVKLPDTVRTDAGKDPVMLERTIGICMKVEAIHLVEEKPHEHRHHRKP